MNETLLRIQHLEPPSVCHPERSLAFVYESKSGVEGSPPADAQLEAKSLVRKCCEGFRKEEKRRVDEREVGVGVHPWAETRS
jgi:hypothetical protein